MDADFNAKFDVISIHAPTRGATLSNVSNFRANGYFNPRSHERSDGHAPSDDIALIISIHAPTRGATMLVVQLKFRQAISIHAPTRGATVTHFF